MASEISHLATLVAGPGGGVLDYISPDGEPVMKFHVPEGRHRASEWVSLVEPGYSLEVADNLVCFPPRAGVAVTHHPHALMSDANPNFEPTSALRADREMRVEINAMREMRLTLQKEAKQRQVDSIQVVEDIPDNPEAAKPAPVAKKEDDAK